MAQSPIHGLYVIIDLAASAGRDAVDIARRALEGSASMIQWRDKRRDKGEQLADARAIRALCTKHDACFIVNDHLDLALAVEADGVHLGQDDMDITEAREILGQEKIVGLSTHSREQAVRAVERGADYIAVGPIFRSPTKDVGRGPLGPEFAGWAAENLGPPVVAIGGIDLKNVAQLAKAGCVNVAVISAINLGAQPAEAARSILAILNSARPGDLS